MATKLALLIRRRGVIMLVVSVAMSLLAAKGGGSGSTGTGFWEGPL